MYNLFVTASAGDWDETPYTFHVSRFLEFTDQGLRDRFVPITANTLSTLRSYPALFAYEGGEDAPARVGWIKRLRTRDGEIRVEYEFEPGVDPIPASQLDELSWDLDIKSMEMGRTHWALKDVDLIQVLLEGGVLTLNTIRAQPPESRIVSEYISLSGTRSAAPVEVRPRLFKIPLGGQEPDLVSVMMPYAGIDQVYAAIVEACTVANMRCDRADNVWEHSEVVQDIFSLIFRSSIVICDFSGRNPNVFYEAGIAHTLGRDVVPIVQNSGDIPFDIQHHRYIQYLNNAEGRAELTRKLIPRLQTLRDQHGARTDPLTRRTR